MGPKFLISRKVGMTSTIDEHGSVRPVTLLSVDEHTVTQTKTLETDGYSALQIGTGNNSKLGKALKGHTVKAKVTPKIIREVRIKPEETTLNVGDKYSTDVFSVGDKVTVSGLSKGKGFAGTIKRHNFHRGRKTHGGRSYRRVGSIGSMYPQHILKGKKMAGRYGHTQTSISNLEVALIDPEKKLIGVYGAVPGPRKNLVIVREVKS